MRFHFKFSIKILILLISISSSLNCWALELTKEERLITLLQTNDLHGAVSSELNSKGERAGGLDFFHGVVNSIRKGLYREFQNKASVLLFDGGDQFQGTLLSNFNEGELVIKSYNLLEYDGVVPGNHDYDFGPKGWLDDRVTSSTVDQDPRGVLKKLIAMARFPFLSANVYVKASLKDIEGNPIKFDEEEKSKSNRDPIPNSSKKEQVIDWLLAKRLPLFQPYRILYRSDLRIAVIGMDHRATPSMTTQDNVSDLYFRDEVETYLEIRKELKGKADIFVLLIHGGNGSKDGAVSEMVDKISKAEKVDDQSILNVVLAGHTHYVNKHEVQGIPIIQSGANGEGYGRVDLVWNLTKNALVSEKTKVWAGVPLMHEACPKESGAEYCSQNAKGEIFVENIKVVKSKILSNIIKKYSEPVEKLGMRVLGAASENITRDRISESALSNEMTDALREATEAQVAFLNTGGIRTILPKGTVTYEQLFRVFPFNNRVLSVGPMGFDKIYLLLLRSAKTCGSYGALMQSGLKVSFLKDCSGNSAIDENAKLLRVENLMGEVLYDEATGIMSTKTFNVATLDFLSQGGSGYIEFQGEHIQKDFGILREVLTDKFLKNPAEFANTIDGRWKWEKKDEPIPPPTP